MERPVQGAIRRESSDVKMADIAMAPSCIHDCFHTHFRWGPLVSPMPKSVLGFDGRKPYAASGAPLVPSNQKVVITLKDKTSFDYEASAQGPIDAGTWTIFYHHGSAYALEVTSKLLVRGAQEAVATVAVYRNEPFTEISTVTRVPRIIIHDVDPTKSFAAFYQRLQCTGTKDSDKWFPRIKILSLEACRNG